MAALQKSGVALGSAAGSKGGPVQAAREGAAGLTGGELEGCFGAVGQRGRGRSEGCLRRRDINRPVMCGRRRIGVGSGIGGPHGERMAALQKSEVALGSAAGSKGGPVQTAREGAASLAGGEAEAGLAAVPPARLA